MIPLTLNLLQGSVTFRFSPSAALDLQREINILLDRLKAIASNAASGGKPQPQKPLEYQHTGDVFLEVFCNPNIYPNPFSAKVLLTVRDDRLRLTTEAELTRVIEDLERYLDQNSQKWGIFGVSTFPCRPTFPHLIIPLQLAMLPTDLLISRQNGETIIPKRLPIAPDYLAIAKEQITCFQESIGETKGELSQKLLILEGDSPDYKIKRGFAHLLTNHFATFEIISPLEPQELRKRVFEQAANFVPIPQNRSLILGKIAQQLSQELNQEIFPVALEKGLYADLAENKILTQFDAPTPENLIHRFNLSQIQGIFYRASYLIINVHRNDPGEYKYLFRYLKLFRLMTYIEGDADTGFTITIDGPTSLFKANSRYGIEIAKLIPALLHVTHWNLKAQLQYKDSYTGTIKKQQFNLENNCGLVSHYSPGKPYDSMLEESFAKRWLQLKTEWQLEREVDLVPLPGGVMIPDFRLVHPEGRVFLLEIVGYWRPEYLQKKFLQVKSAQANNLILAVSERLNLEKAGVKFQNLPAQVIWFKDKLSPQAVLEVLN